MIFWGSWLSQTIPLPKHSPVRLLSRGPVLKRYRIPCRILFLSHKPFLLLVRANRYCAFRQIRELRYTRLHSPHQGRGISA